ncbi:hypothetical protein GE061_012556 [Apolygus lucorum]|uniref:Uncharacterized protein n=1 Tax=Apolygus lucorum TaxID=248454 RepID=A0A6A4JT83_APOLU|nr:hypothetical protein GE061_012556 [Apolygus lucorum]
MHTSKIIFFTAAMATIVMSVVGGYISHEYEEEHHEPAHYNFEYKVNDPHTGDEKTHHESNLGGYVKGFYSLKEADGTIREVHYTADKHNGFQAEVKKIGHPVYQPPSHDHHYHF